MAQYDSGILQTYANALYRRANSIIAAYTLLGGVVGAVGGWFLQTAFPNSNAALLIGAFAVVAGALGFTIGAGRAFMLKLRAQEVLCQRQIEMNTRSPNAATAPPVMGSAAYAR